MCRLTGKYTFTAADTIEFIVCRIDVAYTYFRFKIEMSSEDPCIAVCYTPPMANPWNL